MLHRGLLMAYNEREIHISDFLDRVRVIEDLPDEEKKTVMDRIAAEIEANYPYRKGKPGKTTGTTKAAPAARNMSIEEARSIADVHDAMLEVVREAAMKGKE